MFLIMKPSPRGVTLTEAFLTSKEYSLRYKDIIMAKIWQRYYVRSDWCLEQSGSPVMSQTLWATVNDLHACITGCA